MSIGRRPADYPQFAFRISSEDKELLSELIEQVTAHYNSSLSEGDYIFRKNDIIVEALKIGLREMQKKKVVRPSNKRQGSLD